MVKTYYHFRWKDDIGYDPCYIKDVYFLDEHKYITVQFDGKKEIYENGVEGVSICLEKNSYWKLIYSTSNKEKFFRKYMEILL